MVATSSCGAGARRATVLFAIAMYGTFRMALLGLLSSGHDVCPGVISLSELVGPGRERGLG
eukprot:11813490-Alexandrium_andersonii.AAC.1